jgi:hypothetical protein
LQDAVGRILTNVLGGLITGLGSIPGAIAAFPDDTDFLLRTPEALSYRNDEVQQFAKATRGLANGLLVVITLVGGYNVMLRPYFGSAYPGTREFAPRLILGGILINTAGWWVKLAIDVNNAACALFGAGPPHHWKMLLAGLVSDQSARRADLCHHGAAAGTPAAHALAGRRAARAGSACGALLDPPTVPRLGLVSGEACLSGPCSPSAPGHGAAAGQPATSVPPSSAAGLVNRCLALPCWVWS